MSQWEVHLHLQTTSGGGLDRYSAGDFVGKAQAQFRVFQHLCFLGQCTVLSVLQLFGAEQVFTEMPMQQHARHNPRHAVVGRFPVQGGPFFRITCNFAVFKPLGVHDDGFDGLAIEFPV